MAVTDIAALDQIPVPRFQSLPVYPFNLLKQGITGYAVIGFIVDTHGDVRDPWVVKATHEEFANSAWNCVSKWKFKPGLRAGRKVNTRMAVPIVFNLEEPAAAPSTAKEVQPSSAPPDSH
jgi:protein TonB